MLNRVLYYVLLSTVAGSVFSHTLPLPHEKASEWEQPVVISEQFFPPHPPPHHPPHHIPQNDFKKIIEVELQQIPFHGDSEHEILEHRKHDILEHQHEPHGFFKHHIPPPVLEQEHREDEILSHELPPLDLLDHEHEHKHKHEYEHEHEHEHEHHSHEFHNVLEREHSELAHREHERREHEIKVHEYPYDQEIPDHDHHEHDIAAHQIPHPSRQPPWEDPDFILNEEERCEEHEHEFHHEELFPEGSRGGTNRRRESGSRQNNSNSNRRGNSNRTGNSNRRENSNRQGNNNRRENSNREGSRRNREGSNINSEELFPRRNRQNNNRRNNNNNIGNNRMNNNNREGSRRNSNIEELAALEEEILLNHEVSKPEISRPERDVGSYVSGDIRETSNYDSSFFKQTDSTIPNHGFSNIPTSSQLANNFETIQQQIFVTESSIGGHSDIGNSRRFTNEHLFSESWQPSPGFSNLNNQEYLNSDFLPGGNSNKDTIIVTETKRPNQPSGNIFVKEEEYLTLDNFNSQPSNSRPTESVFNNNNRKNNTNGQSWSQQELPGSSRPGQSNIFGSSRPDESSIGGSSRPGYLGSRPGSGKPLLPGSLPGHESSKPNRPSSSSSGLHSFQEERPGRPSSGSSGSYLYQEERPNRPSGSSSGLHSHQEERPGRPSSSSSGSHFHQEERPNRPGGSSSGFHSYQEERPGRPSSSSSGSHIHQEKRPNRPSGSSSGLHSYEEERPNRPSSGSSGSQLNQEKRPNRPGGSSSGHQYQEERPGRPSSGSSGSHLSQEERPKRPSGSSSGLHSYQEERPGRPNFSEQFSNQGTSKPNRPSSSHSNSQEHSFHGESSRPHRPSNRPAEENSRPRPTNGNNLSNATDLISVQEDSWFWPNQSEDEDKKKRRADSGGNQKSSSTTKRPPKSGSNIKKQHANLKLLPVDSCGVDLGNKIIGGENTQLDEFPWMALLQHSSTDGRALGFGCGGSLISPRYVLTAAHCIKGPAIGKNIRVTKVRLGEFDVSSETDCQGEICSPPPVDIPVEEIIVHPKYRATDRAQLNDIALIRLRENAKTSGYISPICLPLYGNNDHVGEKLIVAGWGKTSNGQKGASSKTKQKVSIPVVTLEECSPFYNRINIQLNKTQMCAGGERGKDSCQGDSGGPLMSSEVIDSQIRWQVHGIVSFGPEDCGIDNVAGVYTKVSEYLDWILDNMKK